MTERGWRSRVSDPFSLEFHCTRQRRTLLRSPSSTPSVSSKWVAWWIPRFAYAVTLVHYLTRTNTDNICPSLSYGWRTMEVLMAVSLQLLDPTQIILFGLDIAVNESSHLARSPAIWIENRALKHNSRHALLGFICHPESRVGKQRAFATYAFMLSSPRSFGKQPRYTKSRALCTGSISNNSLILKKNTLCAVQFIPALLSSHFPGKEKIFF